MLLAAMVAEGAPAIQRDWSALCVKAAVCGSQQFRNCAMGRLHQLNCLRLAVGWSDCIRIVAFRALKRNADLQVTVGPYQVALNPVDSDPFVAAQIFGAREYGVADTYKDALSKLSDRLSKSGVRPVIIDAGANVGYSSLYFSSEYPDADIIAIEPDPVAYEKLQRNCAEVPRIRPINAALWLHSQGVCLTSGSHGSWSNTVSDGDDAMTPSITLEELAPWSEGRHHLLILKMDIEGAEREVVAHSRNIVRQAACIMMEPHDFQNAGAGCLSPLYEAIAGDPHDTIINGENIMLFRHASFEEPGPSAQSGAFGEFGASAHFPQRDRVMAVGEDASGAGLERTP